MPGDTPTGEFSNGGSGENHSGINKHQIGIDIVSSRHLRDRGTRRQRLYHHGYIERVEAQRRVRLLKGGGSQALVISLTNKGAKLLKAHGRLVGNVPSCVEKRSAGVADCGRYAALMWLSTVEVVEWEAW